MPIVSFLRFILSKSLDLAKLAQPKRHQFDKCVGVCTFS